MRKDLLSLAFAMVFTVVVVLLLLSDPASGRPPPSRITLTRVGKAERSNGRRLEAWMTKPAVAGPGRQTSPIGGGASMARTG